MSDDDKDEELSTSFCPYKKAKGFFSGMFSGSKPDNINSKSTAITTERDLNESDDEQGKSPIGIETGRCGTKLAQHGIRYRKELNIDKRTESILPVPKLIKLKNK